ncbi:hypothetical protein BO78DRAFT_28007 [Aspergillus sclerotiicarbonarius CBS 121057]|uniref:Uncharacterized protein n=1 Tax=Aspergillus sclerotiicarbonarius (strain CBS 121057 / IBT 28362) TaxID=1448318 RepID=A0A319DTB5_ASPSB|nr:hypothetical protein BO78DRAFT_28007 [Aspergillus sclerotiicarbonarius CBS 121057]
MDPSRHSPYRVKEEEKEKEKKKRKRIDSSSSSNQQRVSRILTQVFCRVPFGKWIREFSPEREMQQKNDRSHGILRSPFRACSSPPRCGRRLPAPSIGSSQALASLLCSDGAHTHRLTAPYLGLAMSLVTIIRGGRKMPNESWQRKYQQMALGVRYLP